jgi:hypothetical protein
MRPLLGTSPVAPLCCMSTSQKHTKVTTANIRVNGEVHVTAEGDHSMLLVQHHDYSTNIVQLSVLILAQTHIQFLAGPRYVALHQNIHTSSTAHPVACSVGTLNSFATGKVARVCQTTHLPL